VTGGASGIGEATVRRFVKEGAKVAFADRDAERGKRLAAEIAASGGEVVFVEALVEREAEAAGFVRQAAQRFGRLDILVNNAGVRLYHTVEEASAERLGRDPRRESQGVRVLRESRDSAPAAGRASSTSPRCGR
jgi:meso-butanediol dehydrogenase / (S,S)-butanediol dehydrogenase / diacetyl reductase